MHIIWRAVWHSVWLIIRDIWDELIFSRMIFFRKVQITLTKYLYHIVRFRNMAYPGISLTHIHDFREEPSTVTFFVSMIMRSYRPPSFYTFSFKGQIRSKPISDERPFPINDLCLKKFIWNYLCLKWTLSNLTISVLIKNTISKIFCHFSKFDSYEDRNHTKKQDTP